MKYCRNCGSELNDNDRFCPHCGCRCDEGMYQPYNQNNNKVGNETLQTIAKIFMILSCISAGFFIIPLFWMVPMTIHYFKSTKEGIKVSTSFKVCSLIFVNMIAGILMLCDD